MTLAPEVQERVSQSPDRAARGTSDIFRAMQAHEDSMRSKSAPPPPSAPDRVSVQPTPPVEPVKPVVSPTPPPEPAKPVGQPTAPEVVPVSPLDLLKEPEVPKNPPPGEDPELAAKMAEWDKELPTTPEIKTQSSKDSWDKMRESYKASKREAHAAQKERETLQARIAELEKAPPVAAVAPEEIEAIKRENMTLKQKNAVWALETDENFVNKVLKPLDEAGAALGGLMETYKITATQLDEAFSEKDRIKRNKMLSEIITDSGMNPLDTEDFKKAIGTVGDLSFKRDQGYQNAMTLNEAAKAQEDQQKTQKAEMSKKEIEAEEGKIWDKISKNAPVIKDILADAKVSTDIRSKVKEYLGAEQTHEMKVFSAYASYILPHIPGLVRAKDAEIASLKEALQKAVGGESPAGSGHPPSRGPAPTENSAKVSTVGQAVRDWERSTGKLR